jgi:hypothetical protein
MKRDDNKTGKDRDTLKVTESTDLDKHNPFKDAAANQNKEERTQDEEAIAEQQRKETLTERD